MDEGQGTQEGGETPGLKYFRAQWPTVLRRPLELSDRLQTVAQLSSIWKSLEDSKSIFHKQPSTNVTVQVLAWTHR